MTDNQIVNQNEIMEENTAPEAVNYDENQIQVLEGLELSGYASTEISQLN